MKHYDYCCSDLFGMTFTCLATQAGKKCLIIDMHHYLGDNFYCE